MHGMTPVLFQCADRIPAIVAWPAALVVVLALIASPFGLEADQTARREPVDKPAAIASLD
jgi:hypothetical protein